MWPNQIRSYYLTANANSANPNPNSKFDPVWQEKGSTVAVQRWHLKCTTPTFKQIKTTRYFCKRSLTLCILLEIVFGANRQPGVQLILVQGSSPPRIVLLWDPRGSVQGVCGPRGALLQTPPPPRIWIAKVAKIEWPGWRTFWGDTMIKWVQKFPGESCRATA